MLRRLSAYGLLAGVVTGATAFGAILYGESQAAATVRTLATAAAATDAATSLADVRAQATTAHLRGGTASAQDVTNSLGAASAALAQVETADGELAEQVAAAQRALPAYAVAAAAAVTDSGASPDAASGQALVRADSTLAEQTAVITQLATQGRETSRAPQAVALLPLVLGGAATALLAGAGWWLARRTHRVINPPLAVGTLLVAGATALGVGATVQPLMAAAAPAQTGSLSSAAAAREAGAEARAAELAALLPGADIANATADSDRAGARVEAALTADSALGSASTTTWSTYDQVRARTLAQATSERTSAATSATTTGQNSYAAYRASLPAVTANPALPAGGATPWAWLALLAGIGGGSLAWIGLDRRLKDYR